MNSDQKANERNEAQRFVTHWEEIHTFVLSLYTARCTLFLIARIKHTIGQCNVQTLLSFFFFFRCPFFFLGVEQLPAVKHMSLMSSFNCALATVTCYQSRGWFIISVLGLT